jgi:hypothetical protein
MAAKLLSSADSTRMTPLLLGVLVWVCLNPAPAAAQTIEPSARVGGHVIELARFLESAEIYAGIDYPPLSVFPLRLRDGDPLARQAVKETGQHRPRVWLTMDDALASGRLVIFEKGGGGQVPVVQVENRSRMDHVLIMAGELLSGGKQARTVRQDVIVAPGQQVDVPVLCVEKRRWAGAPKFEAGQTLLPQAIYRELRQGADQDRIWAEVARNNAALFGWKKMGLAPSRHDEDTGDDGGREVPVPFSSEQLRPENPTDSLHAALGDPQVRERVRVARQRILPEVPRDSVGFVFVMGGRAAGAEFFGHRTLAIGLLPKLIDSYMVDVIIQGPRRPGIESDRCQRAAIEFFEQIRRGASAYANTPGAGDGIRSRTPGLLGEGVGLDRRLVHFGIQPGATVIPHPRPDSR